MIDLVKHYITTANSARLIYSESYRMTQQLMLFAEHNQNSCALISLIHLQYKARCMCITTLPANKYLGSLDSRHFEQPLDTFISD